MSARDVKELSEAIAAILGREQGKEERQQFSTLLQQAEQRSILERVINNPLQRYNGRTLVHLAAVNGLPEYLGDLLKRGGDPNALSAPPDLCQTPLHLAAHKGYAKCLMKLLDYGANIRVVNSHRVTPMDLVRGKEKSEAVLHQAIAKVDIPPRSQEQQQLVRDLHQILEEGKDIETFYPRYQGLRETEKDLGTRWTDWFQKTLLYRAVENRRDEVVHFLLQQSQSQPLSNLGNEETPLTIASRKGLLEIASVLLRHSPHLVFLKDKQLKLTPLHIAASRGDHNLVKEILDVLVDLFKQENNRPDLNFVDVLGRTPLFNACYHGRAEVVHQFLEFNKMYPWSVDTNRPLEKTARTPLHAAVAKGSEAIIKMLLKDGHVNVNVTANPSDRSVKSLKKDLDKRRSQTSLPSSPTKFNAGTGNLAFSYQPTSHTPFSSSPTPNSNASENSDDLDSRYGILQSPNESPSHPDPHPRNRIATSVDSVLQNQDPLFKRATTVTTPAHSKQSSLFEVVQNASGLLSTSDAGVSNNQKPFCDILITPLAEACIVGNHDIIDLLLDYGARDRKGMACQVAFLLKKMVVMHKILSREVSPMTECDWEGPHPPHLLNWENKNLQSIFSSWLNSTSQFYVDTNVNSSSADQRLHMQINSDWITHVDLYGNLLRSVPVELFCLQNVVKIDISKNSIEELPEVSESQPGGWRCNNLKLLYVNNNKLSSLPTSLWHLPCLQRLRADSNKLTSLFTKEVEIDSPFCPLTDLIIQYNQLESIPIFIFLLPKISKVNLSHNQLVSLPGIMWESSSLEDLDLSHNNLVNLPSCEINELYAVSDTSKSFTASNVFNMATPYFSNQTRVKLMHQRSLYNSKRASSRSLSRSSKEDFKIKQVVDQAEQKETHELEWCDYSSLSKLNISFNKLTFFPSCLPCLAPNLSDLDISQNSIEVIDIQFLPQGLQKLTAKRCKIMRFGAILNAKQSSLIKKTCSYDQQAAVCLHRHHDSLQFLTSLYLTNNGLREINLLKHPLRTDHAHEEEKELEYVASSSNFDMLYPALEGLDLTGNQLEGCLNPNFGRQLQLKWIRLSNNEPLEQLPKELAHLKKSNNLNLLEIKNLPKLVQPPPEYHSMEPNVGPILTYLKSLLKKSTINRSMKLFFIGMGKRGKTTLLHRLMLEHFELNIDRTVGIDIERWECRGQKKKFGGIFQQAKDPIKFICWDFAGQDVYQVTHQCFYSRRSLYLALFRLCDGRDGVDELDMWLRNVQLRAPGCVVIIVGTHLDKLKTEQESVDLEKYVITKYGQANNIYPQVVACVSVSCKSRFNNNLDKLRQLIYDTANRLVVHHKDSSKLEYKQGLKEGDPQALLQQLVPSSFLNLQERITELVRRYHHCKRPPIIENCQFYEEVQSLFDDKEEMEEAIHYLNLQGLPVYTPLINCMTLTYTGTLLHFNDFSLRKMYFLDPQWLAKMMSRVINTQAEENESLLVNGRAQVTSLFQDDADEKMRNIYLSLLQKFEVVLRMNEGEVIIPSLMAQEGEYPQPDISQSIVSDPSYQPPLHRFWLAQFLPEGFWPRLMCRVVKDQPINVVLEKFCFMSSEGSSVALHDHWKLWKTGMAFVSRGRTLVLIRQFVNTQGQGSNGMTLLPGNYRIEVHVNIPDMVTVLQELADLDSFNSPFIAPFVITSQATSLLVAISNHILALDVWFNSMLLPSHSDLSLPNGGYIPCWKCYFEIPTTKSLQALNGLRVILRDNGFPIHSLVFNDCIVPACRNEEVHCPFHGPLDIVKLAPDLVFHDLLTEGDSKAQSNTLQLSNESLGKGGFGFVCKGTLHRTRAGQGNVVLQDVAVKVFMDLDKMDNVSIAELVKISSEPENLCHGYKEIRQEVSFLSSLDHSAITKLCGVMMQPTICLLLELAPKMSLRAQLKSYHSEGLVLEPTTLKQCAKQIAAGLKYLHSRQIVHLDMKSPNVLVWEFPEANSPRRVEQAGNVKLKITDYGISQISPTMVMKVDPQQVGTPGYMAPELFSAEGQEILATKVDVFAFGMVLYELISLQAPFYKHLAHKRNAEVRSGRKPPLGNKEKHSPLLLQDLMCLCWSQDPDKRPEMDQCLKWISSVEFERLRADVTLGDVSSVACVCVSHINLENEGQDDNPPEQDSFTPMSRPFSPLFTEKDLDQLGIQPRILHAEKIVDQRMEMIGQTAPSGGSSTTGSRDEEGSPSHPPLGKLKARGSYDGQKDPESYTQLWMCGRDVKKGLLTVLLFADNHRGYRPFLASMGSGRVEITSMCLIKTTAWMGMSTGTLQILNASTLNLQHTWKLAQGSAILKILHVQDLGCVLVTTHGEEICVLKDKLFGEAGLAILQQITCGPVYDLVMVKQPEGGVEVWGTMDNNTLLLLQHNGDQWNTSCYSLATSGRTCTHIVCCSFAEEGMEERYLWIAYRSRDSIICFDALKKKQLPSINCYHVLKGPQDDDDAYRVTTLLAQGRVLYVGTTSGVVAMFDSLTRQLISRFAWHSGKVRYLIALPDEIKASLCAEVPLEREQLVRRRGTLGKQPSSCSPNTALTNNRPLIASIGNGRQKYSSELTMTTKRLNEDITVLVWQS